jgi:hypothetical protein
VVMRLPTSANLPAEEERGAPIETNDFGCPYPLASSQSLRRH